MAYNDFMETSVWQKAPEPRVKIYSLAQKFRQGGNCGRAFGVRSASNPIVHNAVEGFGRFEKGDKTRFYGISSDRTYEIQSRIRASFARAFLREAKIQDDLFADSGIVVMASDTSIKNPGIMKSTKSFLPTYFTFRFFSAFVPF